MNNRQLEFLERYKVLYRQLAEAIPPWSWWTTWSSSGNRFTSPLSKYLEQLSREESAPRISDLDRERVAELARLCKAVIFDTWQIIVTRFLLGNRGSKIRGYKTNGKRTAVIRTFAQHSSFSPLGFVDPFFPGLSKKLEEENWNVIVLAGTASCHRQLVDHARENPESLVLPIFYFSRIIDVAWATVILVTLPKVTARTFSRPIKWGTVDIAEPVARIVAHERFTYQTWRSILAYLAIRRLARSHSCTQFLYTFENNPWERLMIHAWRRFSPQTVVKGFQHTIVPPASLNYFLPNNLAPQDWRPDAIITSGPIPHAILQKWGSYEPEIELRTGGAIRYQYLESIRPKLRVTSGRNLFLMLEGTPQIEPILRFVESQKFPWETTIRFHPDFRVPVQREDFKVSKNRSASDDLNRADVVLYWGSTVGLEALAHGIPTIAFDVGGLLSYDPLFEFSDFKWTLTFGGNIQTILQEIEMLPTREYERRQRLGIEYAKKYFGKCDDDGWRPFLEPR